VLHDIVYDVRGRIEHAAGLLHLGLVLHLRPVPGGKADHLAQKLLVHLPQDLRRQHRKLVGAFGVVQAFDDILQRSVVNGKRGRKEVGLLGLVLFVFEVEDAGVVARIGAAEELDQARVNARAVGKLQKLSVGLDAAVLADTKEDDAVYGSLNGEIELARGERGIAKRDVPGERLAPRFYFAQEGLVHAGRALFAVRGVGVTVERAF